MLKKLRIKFVCINMLIVTAMLCTIFGLVIRFTASSLETESLQMMEQILDSSQVKGPPHDPPVPQVRLPYFLVEIDRRGSIVASSGSYYDLSDEDLVRRITAAASETGEEQGILEEYDLRFCKRVTPVGVKIIFSDTSSEQLTLHGLYYTCAFIGVLSFLIFFGISFFLARWAIKPVEQAWQQQKQFVADASHELKTPLTVIMTNAELLQNQEYSPEDRARFSDSILTVSHRMRQLVESLLELARVDNGAVRTAFSELDLSELVGGGILPFEPLYFEKDMSLVSRIDPGIRVRGSADHLSQVLEILLDNAMKYSSPDATVRVTLKRHGSHVLLSVSNPGPPLSHEDQKNIFKRFYRVDKARSGDGSFGLGLPIAQSVVADHGGKIWASSSNGINTFSVQLPAL